MGKANLAVGVFKPALRWLVKDVARTGEKAAAGDAVRIGTRGAARAGARNAGRRSAREGAEGAARRAGERAVRGDPVDVVTGEMVLARNDVELAGILPLVLSRTHVSSYRTGRWFGLSWASTLDQRVEIDEAGVCFVADDGMILEYPLPTFGESTLPHRGPRWPLASGEDGFTVTDPERGRTLHFAAQPGAKVPGGGGRCLPIKAIADRNGNRVEFAYDAVGTPTEVRHSAGYRIDVSVEDGRVTELRMREQTLVRHEYDDAGRLIEVADSSGCPTRFDYDAADRIVRWCDTNGLWYTYTYDDVGRVVRGEGAGGVLGYTFAYHDGLTIVTDSLGNDTAYHLDERGRIVAETDPTGATTRSEWDALGRPTVRTDSLGRTVRYSYDEAGNLTEILRPDGERITAAYNELCLPVTIIEPGGAVWRQDYDDQGNLVRVTDPLGAVTAYASDQRGGLAAVTDPHGAVTRVETDAAGLPLRIIDPLGGTTSYMRDGFGRPTQVTDPVGGVTRFGWTLEGRPAWRTLPDGATERWRYDGEGNHTEYVDALGRITRYEVGHFDQRTAEIGPDGTRLEFTYDTELRLVAVMNPQGRVWRYDYDAAGNLVRETDFNGRVLTYSHDAAGQLTQRVNGAGQATDYVRDALGNVVEQRSDSGIATFTYDGAGRLVRAVNADADLHLRRDVLGRTTAEVCNGRTLAVAYDRAGRRVRRLTPSGAASVWEYDPAGRPTTAHIGGRTVRFDHDPAGREIQRHFGTAVLGQSWDSSHRMRSQTLWGVRRTAAERAPVLQHRIYNYRSDGNLTGIDDQRFGSRRFGLDTAGRVTAVSANGWNERYAYDAAGNLTGAARPVSPEEADGLGEREFSGTLIRRAGTVRYEHDDQGRVVLRQHKRVSAKPATWRYTWDSDDRLVGVLTPDGERWRYRYDALGRRVAKQRLATDGRTVVEQVDFAWDGVFLAECAERRGTTAWEYEPAGFRPLAQVERSWPREGSQEAIDEQFYGIIADVVGAPAEMVDAAGNVSWLSRATLWGSRPPDPPGQPSCPLRFPGQYFDAETGLNYNYHRYYDPNAARYCTPDPLGLSAAPNHHAYVPNPLRALDPLGLNPCTVAIDAGSGRALASADRSVANRLLAQIGDRQIIMPRTAYNEFQNAVSRLAGPEEKKLAQELMQRVRVVDDNPSARAAALKVTKKVGAEDIQIFGTADRNGVPIFTSDFKFLRGASAQGVDFDAFVHPPMSFLGR